MPMERNKEKGLLIIVVEFKEEKANDGEYVVNHFKGLGSKGTNLNKECVVSSIDPRSHITYKSYRVQ